MKSKETEVEVDKSLRLLSNNLNRTNSNSSCNSDSDYHEGGGNFSSSSLSCSSSSCSAASTPTTELKQHECASSQLIVNGFYGKAKNLTEGGILDGSSSSCVVDESTLINYGDDVAFILNKSDNKCYYFGLADGVSANRLRGYDARLFPIALLTSCVDFMRQDSGIDDEQDDDEPEDENEQPQGGKEPEDDDGYNTKEDDLINTEQEDDYFEEEEDIYQPKLDQTESSNTKTCHSEECDFLASKNTSAVHSDNNSNNSSSSNEDDSCSEGEDEDENDQPYEDENDEDDDGNDQNGGQEEEELNDYSNENTNNYQEPIYDHVVSSKFTKSRNKNPCKYLFDTLIKAHNLVQEQKVYGSSTVCLLSLKLIKSCGQSGLNANVSSSYYLLSTCNLGDSGYMIIRNKQVIFKSQTQSHRFNAPYQIGCTPPELLDHDLYRDRYLFCYF